MIDSDVADMKNTGSGRYGGAITAALLLNEFVGDVPGLMSTSPVPPSWTRPSTTSPRVGTGFGVRSLVELAETMAR